MAKGVAMGAGQDRVASIFEAVVELATPAQRAAYLDAACGPDRQLRAEVEELLRHDDAAGSFLDPPARPDPAGTAEEPAAGERPGTMVGPYKLLERIGEGGFGVVFLAEQTRPVRRKVALKVLKPGMDTRQVVARFEAERQALALWTTPTSPTSSTAAPPPRAGRTSSWSWSAACPSPRSATRATWASGSGWGCSGTCAGRCSTRTRRVSSTATSSRLTCW
jgi:hypothetical protein